MSELLKEDVKAKTAKWKSDFIEKIDKTKNV